MIGWDIAAWGVVGGIGAEVAVIYDIFHQKPSAFPWWYKSGKYYFVASIMLLLGGAIALAHSMSGSSLNPILAIQIGASTPLILRKLRDVASEPPSPPDPAKVD
jgi:hypothetical protein